MDIHKLLSKQVNDESAIEFTVLITAAEQTVLPDPIAIGMSPCNGICS